MLKHKFILYFVILSAIVNNTEAQVPLDHTPVWQSNIGTTGREVTLCDVEQDGDLDLVIVNDSPDNAIHIYKNVGPFFEYEPSWSIDCFGGVGASWGDIDNDGNVDLAVAAYQHCYLYKNTGDSLEHTPSWTSALESWPFDWVGWGDVDNDGDLDVAVAVYDSSQDIVYLNTEGVISLLPDWYSSPDYNSWGIAWGDVDADGIVSSIDTLIGNGFRKLYYFADKRIPVHCLDSILINGIILPQSDYCYNITSGWISLKDAPPNGDMILIHYKYSTDLDLAISYSNEACALFQNTNVGIVETKTIMGIPGLKIFPNPFSGNTTITFLADDENYTIEIFDISGKKVKTLENVGKSTGKCRFFWNGSDFSGKQLPSGTYFCICVSQNISLDRAKAILLK